MDSAQKASEMDVSSALGRANALGSPSKQGQHFEPLDKASSSTVKLNPKMDLGKTDLLQLLSCMEAELQARDVVIATLKTERIKNLLHYGRVSVNDPILALQRDSISGMMLGGGGASINQSELHNIEETQLQQLENLITQQRRAQARMRHILREAEKRHSWTVEELEKERRNHDIGVLPEDDFPQSGADQGSLKQELDHERAKKKQAEREMKKAQETLEEERGKQKQIILMLVEERRRLALQYVEERKRSEDLAQILSEEKGRIDAMAEGLEEESKKSLQMEAELEKQLAEFDTERQQMRGQMLRKEDRIMDLECAAEKLHREVEHYKKQLQEAHNVAMFQQTLTVSPPRLGISPSQRTQPPQIPVKPTSLGQAQQQRLQSSPALSNVTKAVQLTATVNSVPVTGPTTGIARGIQPGIGARYSTPGSDLSRAITTTAKTFSDNDSSWMGSSVLECDTTSQALGLSRTVGSDATTRSQSQVVQVSPRVNVSASPGSKVITTTHGGKVTLHVTTNASSSSTLPSSGGGGASSGHANSQSAGSTQTMIKKPLPPTRATSGSSSVIVTPSTTTKSITAPPPVPPNKPVVPSKKDLVVGGAGGRTSTSTTSVTDNHPISVEVKPQKVGSQTVKFGITISKTSGGSGAAQSTGGPKVTSVIEHSLGSTGVEGGSNMVRRESSQVDGAHQLHDSLSPELENFHQLLSSMAGTTDIVEENSITNYSQHVSSSSQTLCPLDTEHSLPLGDTIVPPNRCVHLENHLAKLSDDSETITTTMCPTCTEHHQLSRLLLGQNGPPLNGVSTMPAASNCLPLHAPPCPSLADENPPITAHENESSPLTVDVSERDEEPPNSPVDVSTPLTVDGMTALHLAAQGNNYQFVPMLIRCGSSAYAEDDEGRTPLYLALLYGCTMAAQVLLQYAENLEHTTKSGNNYLHAAVKSADLPCLWALLRCVQSRRDNCDQLLRLLATSPDSAGETPLAMCVQSPGALAALADCGLDLVALVAHDQRLLHLASVDSMPLLQSKEDEITCKILLQGASLFRDLEEVTNWSVGCMSVSKETTWPLLYDSITTLLLRHWQKLCSFSRSEIDGLNDASNLTPEEHFNGSINLLELQPSSIESILVGKLFWSPGSSFSDKSPYEMLDCEVSGFSVISVYLQPLETISYTCLIPVSLVQSYLRLLEQSKYVVLYGAKNSGKATLARFLATFYCDSCSREDFTSIRVQQDTTDEVFDCVRRGLAKESFLVLERLPKGLWSGLAEVLKQGRPMARVLATVDSWRRPAGKLEGDVLWVQLRHDREPLCNYLVRCFSRRMVALSGVVPSACEWYQVVRWIARSYAILSDILMSLGFSSVLRGPKLFTSRLTNVVNCRDIIIKMNELWWQELAPAICSAVEGVWHDSGDTSYDKQRVCAMAVHVIQQKVLCAHLPRCAQLYAGPLIETNDRLESKQRRPTLPPRPKNLHLLAAVRPNNNSVDGGGNHKNGNSVRSPLSPEWTQDNLAKILGVTPMGYS